MYKPSTHSGAEESQDRLCDALFQMLKKQLLSEIKITQLCHHAGVSRNAFYRNFTCLEDILVYRLDQACIEFVSCQPYQMADLEGFFTYYFTFWLERQDLLNIFISNRCLDLLLEQQARMVEQTLVLPPQMRDHTPMKGHIFLSSGLLGMIYFYNKAGCSLEPRQIAKWLIQNLRYGLTAFPASAD